MGMGQAAGTAAAAATSGRCGLREIGIADLQHRLRSDGAILDPPFPWFVVNVPSPCPSAIAEAA